MFVVADLIAFYLSSICQYLLNATLIPLSKPRLTSAILDLHALTLPAQSTTSPRRLVRQPVINPRPIPNSYWATDHLIACEYPWAPSCPKKLDALLDAGVRTFIDLTECGELSPYAPHLSTRAVLLGAESHSIEYHRFPIRDRSLPQSVDYMYRVLHVLRDNERRGRISAVHCRGGIGRTGMVVGCWLVESGIARNGDEALRTIAREWKTVEKCTRFPHSPETGPQFEFVQKFRPERMPTRAATAL